MPEIQEIVPHYIGGRWLTSSAAEFVPVHNPARGTVIARTPLASKTEVDAAVQAAAKAFPEWSETPPVVRARTMFTFKQLLEQHFDEIARTIKVGATAIASTSQRRRAAEPNINILN